MCVIHLNVCDTRHQGIFGFGGGGGGDYLCISEVGIPPQNLFVCLRFGQ